MLNRPRLLMAEFRNVSVGMIFQEVPMIRSSSVEIATKATGGPMIERCFGRELKY